MPRRTFCYIIREVFPYLLIALSVLTVIVFASQAGEFSELFVKKNVPPTLVRTLLLSLVPRILILTLPVSLLIATMTGFARMSSDGETTALFASGLSRAQVLAPMLMLGLLISSAAFSLIAFEMPRSARRFRQIRAELIVQGIRTQVKPRVFDDRFANKILYIGAINRHNDVWDRIFLALTDGQAEPIIITARKGRLELGPSPDSSTLSLFEGVIHKPAADEGKPRYDVEAFDSSHIRFDAKSREAARFEVESQGSLSLRSKLQEMTMGELLRATGDKSLRLRAQVEFQKRLALSLSPLVFAVVGVALGISGPRRGRGAALGLSVLLAAIYYLGMLGGENVARSSATPLAAALVWSGNVLLLGFASTRFTSQQLPSWMHYAVKLLRMRLSAWKQRVARWAHSVSEKAVRSVSLFAHYPRRRLTDRLVAESFIVDRYLVRTFGRFFLTVLVGLWTLFTVFTAFEVWPDVLRNAIPARELAQYLFYLSPGVISYLAPPTALIAGLITMSVLSKTSEMIALQAAGFSVYRAAAPVLVAALGLSAGAVAWQQFVVPDTYMKQDQLRFYIKRGRFPSETELSSEFTETNWVFSSAPSPSHSSEGGRDVARENPPRILGSGEKIFHFRSFKRHAGHLDHPLILELRENDFTICLRLEADEARWTPSQHAWIFTHGLLRKFDGGQLLSEQRFDQLVLRLDEKLDFFERKPMKPDAMGYTELAAYIRDLQRSGRDTTDLKIALERKKANAAACFVMTLFGIPFGLLFGRRGALQAVGIGVAIGLVYWLTLGFFEQLGKYEYLSPVLAAWSPNGLLSAIGTYLLFRVRT